MNLQEMYLKIDEDYEELLLRIPREKSIIKYLRIFASEEEFGKMICAAEAKDYITVFSISHSLKGVCANLGLAKLAGSISEICESVRGGEPAEDITPLLKKAEEIYTFNLEAINGLED